MLYILYAFLQYQRISQHVFPLEKMSSVFREQYKRFLHISYIHEFRLAIHRAVIGYVT